MVSKQHGPIDDDKIDQQNVYAGKLSCWKHGTYLGTKTYEFWVLMRMSKAAKEPLQHLLHFLEKDVLDARGSTHLSLLVCGKANDMLLEFDALLDDPTWTFGAVSSPSNPHKLDADQYLCAFVSLVLVSAAQFDFRITDRVTSFPYLLLWMVYKPADVVCKHRSDICKRLCDAQTWALDLTSAKIRLLFKHELAACAISGIITHKLYDLICELRRHLLCSNQRLESINSVLTAMTYRGTRLEQPAIACRLIQKQRYLELAQQHDASPMQTIMDIHNDCLHYYKSDAYNHIDTYRGRWLECMQGTMIPLQDGVTTGVPIADGDGDHGKACVSSSMHDCISII